MNPKEAYEMVDYFLRNNLDDVDYAEYSQALYALTRTDQGPEWTPVGERLPKPYEEVMVWPIPSNNSRTAEINTIGTWRYDEYELNFGWTENVCEVTHWMPLPAPPDAG